MKTAHRRTLAIALVAGLPLSALAQTKAVPVPPPGTRPVPPSMNQMNQVQPGQGRPGTVTTKSVPQPITPAGTQPGTARPGQPGNQATGQGSAPTVLAPATAAPKADGAGANDDQELVNLPAFTEPVQLSSLVELVARTLKINVAIQGDVPGTVVFNAAIPVKKGELISLLDSLLEQQNYTITQDEFGRYTVHPLSTIASTIGGDQSTTRIIRTPNLRPSSLKSAIELQLGAAGPQGTPARSYAYIDELGLIIMTDSPRRISAVERLVERIIEESSRTEFTRIELHYLAASIARQRVLELVGATAISTARTPGIQEGQQGGAPAARQASLDNMADRLVVDAQGNALIFRGLPEEADQVRGLLSVIDVPNNLIPRNYAVGSWASSIANMARQRGLGEVTTINEGDSNQASGFGINQANNFQRLGQLGGNQQQQVIAGGPMLVVDETRGTIIYYATEPQHEQMAALIREIDPQSEKIIIGVYKVKNSDAEEIAAVIQGIIENTQPVGSSDLLPSSGSANPRRRTGAANATLSRTRPTLPGSTTPNQPSTPGELSLEGGGYVVADKAHNQILVKAPQAQQPEFARLIEKLDLRRPQVYIEAKIVAVTWTDDLRLAVETQLINAGGQGGLINTNFGLSSLPNGILNPKVVSPGLGGLTSAVVRSDYVPIIINALQTKANARVLSSPQLLVDDNEEAEIISIDTQPTSTVSRGTGTSGDIVTAGNNEEAGTTLRVTPQISDSGYLRLEYAAELSSFTGSQVTVGGTTLPSPKQVNTINAHVTIPADTTVVVGGLNVDFNRLTKVQVPLLGDIPIIGLLFQDRNVSKRHTTLYIFLTPRILRDPTFADLRLLTRGPQAEVELGTELPKLRTAAIDINSNIQPARMPAILDQPLHDPEPQPAPINFPEPAAIPLPEPDAPVRERKGRPDIGDDLDPAAPIPLPPSGGTR